MSHSPKTHNFWQDVKIEIKIFLIVYFIERWYNEDGDIMYYKRRVKKGPIIVCIIIILIVILAVCGINLYKYYTSDEYRLGEAGYSEDEIKEILKFDSKYITYAIEHDYEDDFIPLVKEKYFLWKNYDRYIKYIDDVYGDKKVDYSKVISLVNVGADNDPYTHTKKADMDKGYAILVNKYTSLPEKYAPDDVVEMSNWYSYPGNSIRKDVYNAFIEMFNVAKEAGYTLIVNSSYRTYEEQKEIYDDYESNRGQEYADTYAARPDFSEHQTGLSLDIFSPGANMSNFADTETFKWLSENCYKYGFILRYPEGKEDITGYSYEAWHYRYVGKELAEKVYDSGLTYDEYYAYYLDN